MRLLSAMTVAVAGSALLAVCGTHFLPTDAKRAAYRPLGKITAGYYPTLRTADRFLSDWLDLMPWTALNC